ncbi:3-isopropylmalate dehydratase small subunit [Massilia sp. TWR1-2-2]|uniref:3-isopropylmalate dehydratase small subunit n=1 Tax=Massilia sp. TWR1-2-2 TaxID=2804584 RepID=UPI003CE684BC
MVETANRIAGVAAAIPIDNLDTDQIMPKQFLRIIGKAGLAKGVLYDLRFDGNGDPRPDFVLNRPGYEKPAILIGGANFGCGSSREHAVWGLLQLGVQAVIASSFGEIFFGNAFNNRLLLITLDQVLVDALAVEVATDPAHQLQIDLESMQVHSPSGRAFAFTIGERNRRMIIEGLDMIGLTLKHHAAIEQFEARHFAAAPWMRVLNQG